jgi:carboxylesterase type B
MKTVTTDLGPVRGYGDDGVVAYKGIPYAAPPVGALRWRPPQPATPWTAPLDAREFGNDPMQPKSPRPLRGKALSEDCLTLNVWAPAETPPEGAPVMVWLYGGGFMFGSGSNADSDGATYARRGVVMVAPNSRTGVFGWLAHPLLSRESDDGVSGNYGLLDNLAAFAWIQRNIAQFGGDPKRVTVFGCSSGGAPIPAMLMMPHTQGLFAQAILESAGSFRPLCPLDEAEHWGGVVGDDLETMRALPADELLKLGDKIGPAVRQLTTPRILRPIWDGKLIQHEEMDAYRDGKFYAVPTIVGSNLDEGGYHVDSLPITTAEAYREYFAGNFGDMLEEALQVYPGRDPAEVRASLSGVFGDTQFTLGARGLSRALSAREPCYRYLFAHPAAGKLPVHGGEQVYVFGTGAGWDDADRAVSETIQRQWAGFAHTGDPNGPGLPAWPRYAAADDNYLTLDRGGAVGRGWRTAQLDFVESYYAATLHPVAP